MKLSWQQKQEAICSALRALLGDSYMADGWCVVATFDEQVIVRKGPVSLYSYPLTFDMFGKATLGEPAPVEAVYQALSEAHGSLILGPLVEEAESKAKPGSRWLVCAISEGLSKNRTFYSADVLQKAAPLYEGAKVFWNHDTGSTMRDPRAIAGFLRGAKFAVLGQESAGHPAVGAVTAILHATDSGLRERLTEAFEAGNPNLYGLSHTAAAVAAKFIHSDGKAAFNVTGIEAVESVDVVSFPSAGGRVVRLVAGLTSPVPATEEELVMLEQKLKKLRESFPALAAKLSATPTEAEVDALLLEALSTPAPAPKADPPPAKVEPAPKAEGLKPEDRALLIEAKVDRLLKGRTLHEALAEPTRDTLVALFEAGATEDTAKGFLESQVTASAKVQEGGIKGAGGKTDINTGTDEAEKKIKAFDGFFAQKDVDGVARYRGIREAYVDITGDEKVTGLVREAKGISRFSRLFEGLDSSTWSSVLASTLNRALVREYNASGGAYADMGAGWLYETVPANDFRTRERVRFGGYGNFATVTEGNPYPTVASPTDEKASYSVAKRGGVETLTWEMVRNDDVGSTRRIPQRMAFAARRTLYEFIHDFYLTNAAIYDTVALFHANHGGNLGAAALAAAAFTAGRLVMKKQTEKNSSKRLGLILSHLMIPPDLEETAYNLFVRDTNNDAKFIQTAAPTIHVITHAADTNDWFACAGVNQTPQIEIGFLDGREDPEMFVADIPTGGSMFASDKIDMKLRHVYGGAVVDFRGFYGAFGI